MRGDGVGGLGGLAVALAACGGIAVIDDGLDSGGAGGATTAGGLGGAASSVVASSGTWQPTAVSSGGPCLTCPQWFASCNGYQLCPDPAAVCPGDEFERANALVVCVCTGCGQLCGNSCVMFNDTADVCFDCQTGVLLQPCGYEYFRCVGQ
jgi:hypothetical protein